MNFVQPVKALAGRELVEVDRERWLPVHRLKGVGAFEMNRDVRVSLPALMNRRCHVDPFGTRLPPNLLVLPQCRHALRGDINLDSWNAGAREYLVALLRPFGQRQRRSE